MSTIGFETLTVRAEGGVLFAEIEAPPMNLLGPELVRDLVSLIQQAEADDTVRVLVWGSADPDYFISHVDLTRISEYRAEAAKLTGEASIALLFRYIFAFRLFSEAWLLTKGCPARSTEVVAIYLYQEAFRFNAFGTAAATAWIMVLASMLLAAGYVLVLRGKVGAYAH